MPDVTFTVDGRAVTAAAGCSVAAAMMNAGIRRFRRSVGGEPRGPLCGMGVCYECRVTVDGRPHQKGCQVAVAAGMAVVTDG